MSDKNKNVFPWLWRNRYQKLDEFEGGRDEKGSEELSSSLYGKSNLSLILPILLLVTNLFTWSMARHITSKPRIDSIQERSFYAGLERNHPVALGVSNVYTDNNETARNEAWEAINIDAGMIAVPNDFVREKGLPVSQPFVWDESKTVYLLNGHHTLHCVRAVYISLMEFWQDKPQSRRWEHVIHCVDQLRQEALCNADDTPRFSTSDDIPVSGMGQTRLCRNWQSLEDWASKYNACYRYVNQTASYEDFPQIERFIWCPEGSPYKAEVEKVFGPVEWE